MTSIFYEHTLNITTNAAGLAIKAAKNAAAKTANTIYYHVNGKLLSKVAGDVVIPATITIEDQMQSMLTVLVDSAGTFSIAKGIEVGKDETYLSDYVKNDTPSAAVVGYISIINDTAAQFVWATTELDAANLTVAYFDVTSRLGK